MKENSNGRRGFAFAIDSLFAITIIAVFAISVVPTHQHLALSNDAAPQALSKLSSATLRSMCMATAGELRQSSPEINALYSDGNLSENDSEMTTCQLMARLCAEGNASVARARNIAAQVYGPLVPPTIGLAIYSEGALVYNTTMQPASPTALYSSAVFVYSYGKAGIAQAPIGPVKIEARTWLP